MNEFEFIEKNISKKTHLPMVLGVGDDCSVMDWTEDKFLIQSSDCLVEDIHFRLSTYSIEEIAYKSLAVNISDISAMGGSPLSVHLSLAVPPKISEVDLQKFFKSFCALADTYNIQLVGGDLSSATNNLFINVTISGEVEKQKIKYRQGLSQSGVLAVTGSLGESAAGLFCLENDVYDVHAESLVKLHKHIPVELEKAQWFAEKSEIQGMMDLSDGLYSDLGRIEKAKISIDLDQLPISENMKAMAKNSRL